MPQQRLPMRKIRELWLAHAHIIPIVSTRAPPNTCPFPRFRSLEVFRRRPLAVWDVCDGRQSENLHMSVVFAMSAMSPVYIRLRKDWRGEPALKARSGHLPFCDSL